MATVGASAIVRPAPGLLPRRARAGLPALPTTTRGTWWRFTDPVEVLRASQPIDVPPLLDRVDEATAARGLWAVGFVAYEAGSAFDPALPAQGLPAGVPAAWFALFDRPRAATAPDPDDLRRGPVLTGPPTPSMGETVYRNAVSQVLAAIERGDTYQANLTYRLDARLHPGVSPEDLFWRLVAAQETELATFLDLGDDPPGAGLRAVASATPELFVERSRERLVCRPMKGTARRGRTGAEDAAAMARLRATPKERAENVMILDMVRNDLARLVGPGSQVAVTELCTVERYPTVLQMISEAEARFDAAPRPGLADTFRALFPYASITGAPKVATSRILALLETTPRGVYTGAVGVVAPGGNARFGVAIRTASIWGDGRVSYGTGGGIVWDSTADGEWAESQAKARIFSALTEPAPEPFDLLETLAWRPGAGFVLLERHLDRLAGSLAYFGADADDGADTVAAAGRHLAGLEGDFDGDPFPRRVRLLVGLDGAVRSEVFALTGTAGGASRVRRLVVGPEPVDEDDPFLFHKTTHRQVYARAREAAETALSNLPFDEVDDVLLVNRRGELTEATLANLVLRQDGEWVTPPVESGLLAGTLRAELLDRGRIVERVLRPDDLARAENVYLINSVRGWMPARLVGQDGPDD